MRGAVSAAEALRNRVKIIISNNVNMNSAINNVRYNDSIMILVCTSACLLQYAHTYEPMS